MDHLHTGCSGPTALHTLLPCITFVAQHIPGEEGDGGHVDEDMEGRLDKTERGNSGNGVESQHISYLSRGFSMMCSLRLNFSSWS